MYAAMLAAHLGFIPAYPYPDETAGSVVWRLAKSLGRSVASFCAEELALSYQQARGDLDQSLSLRFSNSFHRRLGLTPQQARVMAVPDHLLLSAFQPETRRFDGEIRACPLCMQSNAYGRRLWRTRLAAACPVHGCELVSRCPHCGETLGYQKGMVGLAPLLWLEAWPVCTGCLRNMRYKPEIAPIGLRRMTARWAMALSGRDPYRWLDAASFLGLSGRVVDWFEHEPSYVLARSLAGKEQPLGAPYAAAQLIERFWRKERPASVFYAALGMPFEPSQLAKEIVS